ncbi:hypothetical protein LPH44_12050 (plasmid) [Xylella taiwanensis]|uniref:Uncharacterized protein n=1 Tax=Xylella taiwanensis TaxID=1444770 RepID=A0ABS8TX79_9GAMM|nr:hypothetical protein [Xylella taiwanensis]MCD8459798.1 hypothetical protein [Xylella taiwanensis]MCD8474188.1 hypothetical protein [Xylella taiwanensis]UFN08027.1 hypothetical protein LPH42_12070 [Xylella taiwanensis]UFN10320.1 hypothetical protein LPH45_12075 [Xylella taiwanensis]UFN12608.1 hypothetical protein LPH44_12050 [Xylella taiwanensis]
MKNDQWNIFVIFTDTENNIFLTLGGAGWETKAEWEDEWNRIPESPFGSGDSSMLMLEKIDENGYQTDDRPITAETAEILLGKPIDVLIEAARSSLQKQQ